MSIIPSSIIPSSIGASVAVIMRCKNEMPIVEQVLQKLYEQKGVQFTLYSIDSGSTDGSLEVLTRYSADVQTISAESYQPGRVLNNALAAIRADIIVLLNADAVPLSEYWLYSMVEQIQNGNADAVFCQQSPREDAFFIVKEEYRLAFDPVNIKKQKRFFSHVAAAFKRSLWEKYPYYEEGYSEDCEWANRIVRDGYLIQYLPVCCVEHSHNYTLKQLYRRKFIEGEADGYIEGRRNGLGRIVLRYLKKSAQFISACVRRGKIGDIPHGITWLFVSAIGYFIGQLHSVQKTSRKCC